MPDLADLYPGYASRWNHAANGRIFARAGVDHLAEENPATTAQALLDFFGTG
ncbi:MAG: hypothetical protein WB868_01135 [Xanthobacteraceae bacterium]